MDLYLASLYSIIHIFEIALLEGHLLDDPHNKAPLLDYSSNNLPISPFLPSKPSSPS